MAVMVHTLVRIWAWTDWDLELASEVSFIGHMTCCVEHRALG